MVDVNFSPIVLVFLGMITIGAVISPLANQTHFTSSVTSVNVTAPFLTNPGFETGDLTGWTINTNDCNILSFCAVTSTGAGAPAPQGTFYLNLTGRTGNSIQNNDIFQATGTSDLTQVAQLEFFIEWHTFGVDCVKKTTSCYFDLHMSFGGTAAFAVNYYWANNVTATAFTNSSSAWYVPINGQCGALMATSSYCHYYDPGFITRAQAHFPGLSVFCAGNQGSNNCGAPTSSFDMEFGCTTSNVATSVCSNATWALYVDYLTLGGIAFSAAASTPGLSQSAPLLPFLLAVVGLGLPLVWFSKQKHGGV